MTRLAGGLSRHLQQALRQPVDLFRQMEGDMKRLGGIEKVIVKRGTEFGQLLLNGIETLARLTRKADTGQLRVFNGALNNALLRGIKPCPCLTSFERLETLIKGLTLAEPHPELDHLALHLLMGLAQRLAILHPHQMTHHAPGQAEAVFKLL